MTLENIRFFERQIAAMDKAIARELAARPPRIIIKEHAC